MKLGVLVLPEGSWQTTAARIIRAEQLGFDSVWVHDHIWWRRMSDAPWLAATPVLAAAAAVTTRIQLGLLVASPNFRHPVLTMKEAQTIADIAQGRFTLGVGSGAPAAGDSEILGRPALKPSARARRFAEFVELTDRLRHHPVVDFAGEHYAAHEAWMRPTHSSPPELRLAVAAIGRTGIDLAARFGDCWVTTGTIDWYGPSNAERCAELVRGQVAQLREACRRNGRDPGIVERIMFVTPAAGDPLASADEFQRLTALYTAAGIAHVVVNWPREAGLYAADPRVLDEIVNRAASLRAARSSTPRYERTRT